MSLTPIFRIVYSTGSSGSTSTQNVTGCRTADEAKDKIRRQFGPSKYDSVRIISCEQIR